MPRNKKVGVFPNAVRVELLELLKLSMLPAAEFVGLLCTMNDLTDTETQLNHCVYYSSSLLLVAYLRRSDGSFEPYNIEANSKFRLRTRNADAFGSRCLVKMPFLFPPTLVMAEIEKNLKF